ncbi:MAG TPA: hypothetical protein VGC42_02430 [Kofleriaceae bacterium]
MKHVLSLLIVSLAATTACIDTRRTEPDDATDEAQSALTSTGDGGAKTDITCLKVWECDPICPVYQNGVYYVFPTNVLHKECDDGTDTVVHTDPCGENCR